MKSGLSFSPRKEERAIFGEKRRDRLKTGLFHCRAGAKVLDARGAQAFDAVGAERTLPAEEFLNGKAIAITGIFKGKEAATYSCNNFGFAACDPATGICRRKIRDAQGTAIRANDKFGARSILLGHFTHYFTLGQGLINRIPRTGPVCDPVYELMTLTNYSFY